MSKKGYLFLLIILMCVCRSASADSVVRMHYVFHDYVGEYTGQVDTNCIPFGYGIFESTTPQDGETWHYIGIWESGLPEGNGSIFFDNGDMQKGTFSKGKLINGLKYTVSGLAATPVELTPSIPETEAMYIGNKKSMRFHLPNCRAVQQMKESNKVEFFSREEAIERQFIPCGECNP